MTLPPEIINQLRAGMAPTWLDRQIARMAPSWGLQRMRSRAAMAIAGGSAWTGARRDLPDLMNWNPLAGSPDDEQRYDRAFLLARSSDLERNDALAGGAIAEAVLSVVGTGLSLHPEPNRKILGWSQDQAVEWAEEAKQRFNLWAGDPRECDIRRRSNFYQAQSLAYRTVASRGDCFVLLPRKKHPGTTWAAKFQLVEGDRVLNPPGLVDSPAMNQGVETDEYGGIKAFWFCKKHPTIVGLKPSDFIKINAWGPDGQRLVLPLMHEHRLDLRRGYPLLAPVIQPLKQLSRLSDAELTAAIVTSFIAVVIEKSGTGPGPLGTIGKDQNGKGFTELGPAMVAELNPGESITPVAPVRPNGAFDPFWNSLMGQVAMRLQIPPEVLLKKFNSSYTAARGALQQFWRFVVTERENLLAPDFCQPLYETWLSEEVAAGRMQAPGFFVSPLLRAAYGAARWVGDAAPILDPLKEVMASKEMVANTFSTYAEQTLRLNGGDSEANLERLTRETRLRREAGILPAAMAVSPQVAPQPAALAGDPASEDPADETPAEDLDETEDPATPAPEGN